MNKKPECEEAEQKIKALEKEVAMLKRTQEALKTQEALYCSLVENSLTCIYIDRGGKIVFANDRCAEIYKYSRDVLIGMESRELVHPEDRDKTDKIRTERLQGESPPSEYDAMGLTKEGETIWVRRRNTDIAYEGEPAILGNVVDITEQKRTREALERVNQELKDFVHAVTHDLKTPIVAIHGFSQRLLKKHAEKLDEKMVSYLDHIASSARRMEAMVNDLRELSSVGEVSGDFRNVPSQELLNDVRKDFEERLKKQGIAFILDSGLPTIRCDKQKIYQVFANLVENAIKYMGDTKRPKIEIGYEDKGAFHQFSVRDDGVGIDPKDHHKIFQKFKRVKNITDEEGTGLGLAIVKRIVSGHGGKVWLESKKGKGAVFHFTLPKNPPSGSSPTQSRQQ